MKKVPDTSKPNPPPNDSAFEEQVFRGLLSKGHVIPETPDEIHIAEIGVSPIEQPPTHLRDSDAVLRRIKERIAGAEGKAIPFPLSQELALTEELEELGRAARHGSALASSIKEKMAKNRRAADKNAERDEAK